MTKQAPKDQNQLDTASTVRLPIRSSVLAQIEAALLSEKLSVSLADEKGRGKDPYNQVPPKSDSWANDR